MSEHPTFEAADLIESLQTTLAASEARAAALEAENHRLRGDLVSAGEVMADAIRLAHHHGHEGGDSQNCERDTCVIGWRFARALLAQPAAVEPIP